MDLSEAHLTAIREWASGTPEIAALWVFGSRAKGTARPDSDLDLAVEVFERPGKTARETFNDDLLWIEWVSDLEDRVGLVVHLVQNRGVSTPTTFAGVTQAGVLVFCRSTPPDDLGKRRLEGADDKSLFSEVTAGR